MNAGVEHWLGLGGVNCMHHIDWGCVLFQAMVCRAVFPRVLRTLLSRMSAFKEYSVRFEEFGGEQLCIVRTWEENSMLDVCINVEGSGKRAPNAELSSLSRIVCSCEGVQMPLRICGGPQSFLRVLSDNRTNRPLFVYYREFTNDVFLRCYRQAHQEIFGMLEVTTMVDLLKGEACTPGAMAGGPCQSASLCPRGGGHFCRSAGRYPRTAFCVGKCARVCALYRTITRQIFI